MKFELLLPRCKGVLKLSFERYPPFGITFRKACPIDDDSISWDNFSATLLEF